ncbi:MAG: TonB-dependent receptor [Gemmatimonadota bacterium]
MKSLRGCAGRRKVLARWIHTVLFSLTPSLFLSTGFRQLGAQDRPVTLDTLQVQVGSRLSPRLPALTRSVRLVDREEIQSLPVRTVAGLLDWVTGVEIQARSAAQADLSIRGAGFEQVLVLVNGVRASDPQTGHFDLNLAVPLDQVERVEILRGPASALYGADAVGGVVNIVTARESTTRKGRIEGGSFGSRRVAGSGGFFKDGLPSVQVGGELSRSDGHRSGTDSETALVHLSLAQNLGRGRITGDFGYARRDFGAQDFYAPYPSFEKTRTYKSALRWTSDLGSSSSVEMGGSFRRHEDEFTLIRDDPALYQNRHTSSQVGGDFLVRREWGSAWEIAVGGEAYRDLLRSNSLGNRGETRGALFAEVMLGRERSGVVTAGVRQDWHQGFGSFFSPSLSGSLRLGAHLRARGALGRSFRAPTWTERYYQDPVNIGRADLEPERAWSGEVGLDVMGEGRTRFALTTFVRSTKDLIDWARVSEAADDVPWETRNVKEATFRGVEGDLFLSGPFETRWTLGAMALSVESEETAGFTSKYALRPLVQQVRVSAGRSFGRVVALDVNFQRSKRKGGDSFSRLDVRGSLRLGPALIYLDATNLLDAEYPDITGALAPGQAFFFGLELSGAAPEEH